MVKNLIRLSVVFALFASVVPCQAAGDKLFFVRKSGIASINLGGVGGIKNADDLRRVESLVQELDTLIKDGPQASGFNFDSFVAEFRKVAQVDGNEGASAMGGKRTKPLFAREQVRGKPGALTREAFDAAKQLRDSLKGVLLAHREAAAAAQAASTPAAISVVVPPAPRYVPSRRQSPPTQSTITQGIPFGARPVMTADGYQASEAALAAAMFASTPSAPGATVTGQTNTPQANSSSNSGQASGVGSQGAQTPPATTKVKKKKGGMDKLPVPASPTRPSYATVELPTTRGTGWLAAGATGTVASTAALARFLKQGGYDKVLRWFDKQERGKMSKEEKALVKATGLSSGSLLASLLMLARGGVLRRRYNKINTRITANGQRPFSMADDGSLKDVVVMDADEARLQHTFDTAKGVKRNYQRDLDGLAWLRTDLGQPSFLAPKSIKKVSRSPEIDNLIKDLADALVSQKQSRGTGWLATGGAGAAVSVPALIHFLKKGGYKKALKLLSKKERALMSDEDKALAWKTSGSAAAVAASLAALARGGSLRRSHRKAVEAASAA